MKKILFISALYILFYCIPTSLYSQESFINSNKPYKVWQARGVKVINYKGVKKNKKNIEANLSSLYAPVSMKEYDANGNIKKFVSYNKFGGIVLSELFNYDTLNNLKERYFINNNLDTINLSRMYYEDTLLVKQLDFQRIIDTNTMDSFKFKIDLVGITNYQYNNLGNLIGSDYKSVNIYPPKKSEIKYIIDESLNGYKIINLSFDTIEYTTELKYDSNENIISKKEYDSKGNLFTTVKYEYNENSKLILEERKNSPLDKVVMHKYKYDLNGDLIKTEIVSKLDKLNFVYEYLWYDEYGNWTFQIIDSGGKTCEVIERDIVY